MADRAEAYTGKIKPLPMPDKVSLETKQKSYRVYVEGIKLHTQGDNKGALSKFRSAQALFPQAKYNSAIKRTTVKMESLK